MAEIFCRYSGDREQAIVAYLYGGSDETDAAAFSEHLSTCERCRSELAALEDVRMSLARWAPPEPGSLHSETAWDAAAAAIRLKPDPTTVASATIAAPDPAVAPSGWRAA